MNKRQSKKRYKKILAQMRPEQGRGIGISVQHQAMLDEKGNISTTYLPDHSYRFVMLKRPRIQYFSSKHYYLYYNGTIYEKDPNFPCFVPAIDFSSSSFSSRQEALNLISEVQDMLSKNSLCYSAEQLRRMSTLTDSIEVLPSSDLRILDILSSNSLKKVNTF